MQEQLQLLIDLQEIDGRIRLCQEQKRRLPELLAALERKTAESRERTEAVKAALDDAQKAKRDRDRDLEDGAGKVAKLKARTGEIKTNKEYQALLKEIEAAEQENKAIEDELLKLMERIEQAGAEIAAAEEAAVRDAAAVESERRELEAAMAKIDGELAADLKASQELSQRIQAELLTQYRKLLGQFGARVVVEARGESCAGCFMSIPPRTFVSVKKRESVILCPNCHRILYYKG